MSDAYFQVVFQTPLNRVFTYLPPEKGRAAPGCRVTAPFGRRTLTGFITGSTDTPPEGDFQLKRISRVIDKTPLFGEEEIELASWIAGRYLCSIGEALSTMLPGGKRESIIPLFEADPPGSLDAVSLSEEQRRAVEGITGRQDGYSYIYGITGSGKTEVFLQVAEATLQEERGVIYLVPEISLTHQLTKEIRDRFGTSVAVLHSRLTPSQRYVEWMRIKKGEARLVVGARSAVFAPVHPLGLIVIDEEHEGAYKSGNTPRYHARQVAMKRCSGAGARLVMGSATPSVEAFHLMERGRINSYHLTKRLSGGAVPTVAVVDMKREKGTISRLLIEGIRRTREEGRQTILFLNRRGFTYFFHCRSCGYQMTCKQCSVSLTYHKHKNRMVCHYCGYSVPPLDVCPSCGSLDVGYSGFGTEMVEEDVRKLFPDYRITRVDTDAVKKRGSLEKIFEDFKKGEIDILLGTQMVAKGLNFPGVKLVGIVLADTGLHLPDFRAQERTFSLIMQVAGRAGRFFPDGQVIIQTYNPENEAIGMAAEGALEKFYGMELEARKALGFPPWTRLFRIVFRGKKLEVVENAAGIFANRFPDGDDSELLGPAECPLAVISGNYRYQVILRSYRFQVTHRKLSKLLEDISTPSGVYIEVDVDPVSLL